MACINSRTKYPKIFYILVLNLKIKIFLLIWKFFDIIYKDWLETDDDWPTI